MDAKKIATKILKEQMPQVGFQGFNPMSAAGQIGAAVQGALQPVNDMRQQILQRIAAQTDISGGKEAVSKDVREGILDLAAPDVTDAIPLGKVGKFFGAAAPIASHILQKEGKILGKEAPVIGKVLKAEESVAKGLQRAPESKYGKLVVKDTEKPLVSGTAQIKDGILKRLLPARPGSGL